MPNCAVKAKWSNKTRDMRRVASYTKSRTRLILGLITLILLLVGCDEQEDKIRVGVSMLGMAHPEFQLIKLALDENAEKYGAQIVYEREGLAALLADGVDSLILYCPYPGELESAIKEIHRKGIPIVILDCPPPENLHVEVYIKINHFDTGKMLADYVVEKLGGKGNVIVLEGPRNNKISRQITLGMYNVLEQYESIRIVASEPHSNWDEKLAADTVRATLKKYAGNIQAVLAGDSRLAMGAVKALSERHLAGKIITAGVGANLEACEAIIAGAHDAEIDRMPYGRGLEALSLATAIAEDEDFPYDAEIGEEPPKIKVKFAPLRLITKENVSVMDGVWSQLADER